EPDEHAEAEWRREPVPADLVVEVLDEPVVVRPERGPVVARGRTCLHAITSCSVGRHHGWVVGPAAFGERPLAAVAAAGWAGGASGARYRSAEMPGRKK